VKKYDPLETIRHLVSSIGARPATSLEEAQAAAYVDGQLRRVGMRVSADTFPAPIHSNPVYPLIALAGLLIGLLTGLVPLPSLLLAVWLLVLVAFNMLVAPLPLPPLVSSSSQNIVGTRASEQRPQWRVILLGPLDSHPAEGGKEQLTRWQRAAAVSYLAACTLLVLLAALTLATAWRGWWYGQIVPVIVLVAALFPLQTRGTSLVGSSTALAVMLKVAERLTALRSVELWVVALGATTTSDSGLRNLLARYPFSSADTLFLIIEKLESEHLAYAKKQGTLRQYAPDALLVRLLREHSAETAANPLPSCSYPAATALALPLHIRGYRAMSLLTCTDNPAATAEKLKESVASLRAMSSGVATFTPQMLEQATETIVGMVRRLDDAEAERAPP
jgi:hypothetical protein